MSNLRIFRAAASAALLVAGGVSARAADLPGFFTGGPGAKTGEFQPQRSRTLAWIGFGRSGSKRQWAVASAQWPVTGEWSLDQWS